MIAAKIKPNSSFDQIVVHTEKFGKLKAIIRRVLLTYFLNDSFSTTHLIVKKEISVEGIFASNRFRPKRTPWMLPKKSIKVVES